MFKITGAGGSGTAGNAILVYDHTPLIEHLNSIGIQPNQLNFFTWRAFPERSWGRFLVNEKQWQDSFGASTKGKVNLNISWRDADDVLKQKNFVGLEIITTSFIMSPNEKTTAPPPPDPDNPPDPENPPEDVNSGQDGERMLIVELEHNGESYRKNCRIYEQHESFDELKEMFDNGEMLQTPQVFNKHTIPDVSVAEYLAYVASTHFLTVYLAPDGGKPKLTNDLFQYPDETNILFNKVFTLKTPPKFKMSLQSDNLCKLQFFNSDESILLIETLETYFYESPIVSNTEQKNIRVLVPYAMVDHRLLEYDSDAGKIECDRFMTKIKYYAENRLLRKVDIIYLGLVTSNLSNDVQAITYYYQGSDGGLRTQVQTVPWEVANSILAPREVACKDSMFRGVLLEDMAFSNGSFKSTAAITKILNRNYLIDRVAEVNDPLGIFQELKAGQQIYVYQECGSCGYVIVQGECPDPSNQHPGPIGKCCVPFDIENDADRIFCYDTTKKVCDVLKGTWTSGYVCPQPPLSPYCEEPPE